MGDENLPPVAGAGDDSVLGDGYTSGLLESQGRLPPRRGDRPAAAGPTEAWGQESRPPPAAVMLEKVNLHLESLRHSSGNADVERHLAKTALRGLYDAISKDTGETIAAMKLHRKAQSEIKTLRERILLLERDARGKTRTLDKNAGVIEDLRAKVKENETAARRELRLAKENGVLREQISELRATISAQVADGDQRFRELLKRMEAMRERERYIKTHMYAVQAAVDSRERIARLAAVGRGEIDGQDIVIYTVKVRTGEKKGAGTTAGVTIQLHGSEDRTEQLMLSNKVDNFQRGTEDEFKLWLHPLGDIKKVTVGHDKQGAAPGWFLENVTVIDESTGTESEFQCGRWLAEDKDDQKCRRELGLTPGGDGPVEYKVTVQTGDKRGAGTDATVTMILYGANGDSGSQKLESGNDDFERGHTDSFSFDCPDLGHITALEIRHDQKGLAPAWFLETVTVTPPSGGPAVFSCFDWLDKSNGAKAKLESGAGGPAAEMMYTVFVQTGDCRGAGTDANVTINIHGTNTDSGEKALEGGGNDFERAQLDEFVLTLPDLGKITSIRITQDGTGLGSAWFLESIRIHDHQTLLDTEFICSRWLDDSHGLWVDLKPGGEPPPKPFTYKIQTYTGGVRGAGTDANVFIELYGPGGEPSPRLTLESGGNDFEKNEVNTFNCPCPAVGEVQRVRIGHDNSGPGPGWFLDKVTIEGPDCPLTEFRCGRWLSETEDDHCIVRDLVRDGVDPRDALVKYEVSVMTMDKKGSSTDADVTIDIIGSQGSTGDKLLESGQDDFERGQEDSFIVEAFDIGSISKIKLSHADQGLRPSWFCNWVKILNPKTNQQWTFHVQAILNKKNGLVQEFECGAEPAQLQKYRVVTYTANTRGAGTDANVTIELIGEGGETTGPCGLEGGADDFEKGQADEFILEVPDIGKLASINIGHDNSGPGPGWKLDHVLVENMLTAEQIDFQAYRWLAKDQEDAMTMINISAKPLVGPDGLPMRFIVTWTVIVKTADEKGAGTDANVKIKLFGERGNSDDIILESGANDFEKAETNVFKVQTKDIGALQKIRIGHDGQGFGSGWMMESAEVIDDGTGVACKFPCYRWFDEGQDDGLIVRDLSPGDGAGGGGSGDGKVMYEIEVVTGTVKGAGTDANVFIELIGDLNDVGKTKLENSKDNFEKGKTDVFKLKLADVGDLQKIRIGHDSKGLFGSGWFLDSVRVRKVGTPDSWLFGCNKWLDEDEGDGATVRELVPGDAQSLVTYNVRVNTGSERGSGTDATVTIVLYGAEGNTITNNSGERKLESKKDNFERGSADVFKVECMDLGGVEKVRIGHDNSGFSPGWFLTSVEVWEENEDDKIVFLCNNWLDKHEGDGVIVRVLNKDSYTETKYTSYLVKVYTGSVRGAGTDANVFINIIGDVAESGDTRLETSKDDFERGHIDEFRLRLPTLTSEQGGIRKIRIGHDGKRPGSGWYLDKVIIEDETVTGKSKAQWQFPAYRWLDEDEGDKQISVDLMPSDDIEAGKPNTYHITTITGNRRGAGTSANVFVEIVGENGLGETGQLKLEASRSNFDKGSTDEFVVSALSVGTISKIRIGHDATGFGAGWFLDKVIIKDDASGQTLTFPAYKWLDKQPSEDNPEGATICELLPAKADALDVSASDFFKIEVTTGDRRGAGTDANVFIELVGSKGSSGTKKLDAQRSDFERGNTDMFRVECSTVLGALSKLRIGHDNAGWSPAWFLERVVVTNERTDTTTSFGCNKWFDRKEGDKQIIRELLPGDIGDENKLCDYKILVKTGDVRGAGTGARVFINVIGDNGETGDRPLDSGRSNFSRAAEDEFVLQAVSLGALRKLRIGHDNKGLTPGWFLDSIEICQIGGEEVEGESPGDLPQTWKFACGRWLSRTEDDKQIVRELVPESSGGSRSGAGEMYNIEVHTGDVRYAGTDANVYITLFGRDGNSGTRQLSNKWKNDFERAQVDVFALEAAGLGPLEKVRIGHDGTGAGAGWYLDKVVVKPPGLPEINFECKRWLDEKEEDGQTERELYPAGSGRESTDMRQVQEGLVEYKVAIHTGDVFGAGTDATIKLELFGDRDGVPTNSGDRPLPNGSRKFERDTWDYTAITAEDLGDITRVKIGHDNKGFMAGWFLDKLTVTNSMTGVIWDFPCARWFDRDEDDGQVERTLQVGRGAPKLYTVTTVTGGEDNAGTSANVYVELIGELGTSGSRPLKSKSILKGGSFSKNSSDDFEFSCPDLGALQYCVIGHDGRGMGSGWNLKLVTVADADGNQWRFVNDVVLNDGGENLGWLDAKEGDGAIERRLVEARQQSSGSLKIGKETTYVLTVCTGKVAHAGTNANVFVTLYGEGGESGERKLDSKRGHFEKGQEDIFRISATELGLLDKLRIRHDGKGLGAGWFLDRVDVKSELTGKAWSFACNKWLDVKEADGKISRDLVAEDMAMA